MDFPRSSPPNAGAASRRARRRAFAAVAAVLLLAGVDATAQHRGRLEPEQRQQLRSELRERGAQAGRPARADDADGYRMSPQEREQLRRQLRDARPDDWRRRGRGRGRN